MCYIYSPIKAFLPFTFPPHSGGKVKGRMLCLLLPQRGRKEAKLCIAELIARKALSRIRGSQLAIPHKLMLIVYGYLMMVLGKKDHIMLYLT